MEARRSERFREPRASAHRFVNAPPFWQPGERGDVLDLVGQTANFLLSQCKQEPNGASVGQRQLNKVCRAERVGSASVPVAATISSTDIAALASPSNGVFHDQWGSVKLRIEDVSALPVVGPVASV